MNKRTTILTISWAPETHPDDVLKASREIAKNIQAVLYDNESVRMQMITPINNRRQWTEEQMIKAIQDFAKKYGRPPMVKDWEHAGPDWPDRATVQRRFGSWNKAIIAAGLPISGKGRQAKAAAAPTLDQLYKQTLAGQ